MLTQVFCAKCGIPKKTRKGTLCRRCASKQSRSDLWTLEETTLLKTVYRTMQTRQIQHFFPRHSINAINQKAKQLNLHKQYHWTESDVAKIKQVIENEAKIQQLKTQSQLLGAELHLKFAYKIIAQKKYTLKVAA